MGREVVVDPELDRKLSELDDEYWRGGVGLFVPVFGHHIRLLVGSDDDAAMMVDGAGGTFKKLVEPTFSSRQSDVSGMARTLGDCSVIIMRKLCLGSDIDVSVLYHESLHIALKILEKKNIKPDHDGEMIAWLLQYIALGFISRIRSGEFFTIRPDGTFSQPLNRPVVSQVSLIDNEIYNG